MYYGCVESGRYVHTIVLLINGVHIVDGVFPPLRSDQLRQLIAATMLYRAVSLLLAARGAALSPKDAVQSIDAGLASTCSDSSKFFDEQGLGCKNFGERRV